MHLGIFNKIRIFTCFCFLKKIPKFNFLILDITVNWKKNARFTAHFCLLNQAFVNTIITYDRTFSNCCSTNSSLHTRIGLWRIFHWIRSVPMGKCPVLQNKKYFATYTSFIQNKNAISAFRFVPLTANYKLYKKKPCFTKLLYNLYLSI